MATPTEVRRLYNALINSGNIRYTVLPAGAGSVALTAAGAWAWGAQAQVAASVGAVDAWLCQVAMENPSAPAAGYDVDIMVGTAPAGVHLAEVPFFASLVNLPFPIYIAATIGVVGRTRSSIGAATIAVKVGVIIGA